MLTHQEILEQMNTKATDDGAVASLLTTGNFLAKAGAGRLPFNQAVALALSFYITAVGKAIEAMGINPVITIEVSKQMTLLIDNLEKRINVKTN